MIDKESQLSVVKQCKLLGVSRSSVYYQVAAVSDEEFSIMRHIDEIHLACPFLGSRRFVGELKDRGFTVNRKRVQRLLRLMGIAASYPKPSTSKASKGHKTYPYLLRGLEPHRANQVWVADITYLPMARGFAYLVAVMDLYSRKILSWQLSNTFDPRFCTIALEKALTQYGPPEIFNTDQADRPGRLELRTLAVCRFVQDGAHFTSRAFTSVLERHDVRISMVRVVPRRDGKGRWIDNVFIERFWRSLKYEEIYLYAYSDLNKARAGLERYICCYNGARLHSRLGKNTPEAVYRESMGNPALPGLLIPAGALTPRPCS